MANKTSCVNFGEFSVKISYKKVKFARLKISKMGEISASLPQNFSKNQAINFIQNNKIWIKNILAKIPQIPKDKIIFFGILSDIKFDESLKEKIICNSCEFDFENFDINLFKQNRLNFKIFAKNSENLIKFQNKILKQICFYFVNLFSQKTGLNPQKISFNNAKTRFGSCNYNLQKINFSYKLASRNLNEISYVVLHEISHLKYPNHSKNFYDFIEKFMPNFKEFDKSLKRF